MYVYTYTYIFYIYNNIYRRGGRFTLLQTTPLMFEEPRSRRAVWRSAKGAAPQALWAAARGVLVVQSKEPFPGGRTKDHGSGGRTKDLGNNIFI